MTQQEVVDKAREFINTPFHHGVKVKGEGIDCLQLIIAVFQELGAPIPDYFDYSKFDEFERLVQVVAEYCENVDTLSPEKSIVQKGDILLFRGQKMFNHCGIYSGEKTFIHAFADPAYNKVVEEELTSEWKAHNAFVFRYPGVV